MNTRRYLAALLAVMMLLTALPAALAEEKPDSWIADRTITIQAYVDDIGYSLPDDLAATAVMQKVTELTGIKLDVRYTPGEDDATVMASQLAADNIPDAIVCYLNNSTRPEFPILLKAAKEGLFADVTEFMKNAQVYSKYMEEGYLPADAYKNITFREDLDGVYLMQFSIPAVDRSTEYIPEDEYVGGMYIQQRIADALGIDPRSITTIEQFYDLLVKIQEEDFKDDHGNSIYPLGPKYWGGSVDAMRYLVAPMNFNPMGGYYNMTADGKILHEAETDFVYQKISFVRKLLAEKLLHPEFFTMDSTRTEELVKTHGVAIVGDMHNYVDVVSNGSDWVPLGPLNDRTGRNCEYVSGKTGYGAWAISSHAENPEEIFKFFDWMSTYEGQLTCYYGVEGLSYNMVDGYPVMTDECREKYEADDTDWLINTLGAGFCGNHIFSFCQTNQDYAAVFGEARPGTGTLYARAIEIAEQYPVEKVLVPGLDIASYMSDESLADVKASMDLLNYDEMLVQAMFANSDEEVTSIVESFRAQLKSAGIDRFYEYVEGIYAEAPETVQVIVVE